MHVMGQIVNAARTGTVIPYDAAVEGYTVCMQRVIKFASQLDLFQKYVENLLKFWEIRRHSKSCKSHEANFLLQVFDERPV